MDLYKVKAIFNLDKDNLKHFGNQHKIVYVYAWHKKGAIQTVMEKYGDEFHSWLGYIRGAEVMEEIKEKDMLKQKN